jgi:hypothetical protein
VVPIVDDRRAGRFGNRQAQRGIETQRIGVVLVAPALAI